MKNNAETCKGEIVDFAIVAIVAVNNVTIVCVCVSVCKLGIICSANERLGGAWA